MRVFGTIVQSLMLPMLDMRQNLFFSYSIAFELIRYQHERGTSAITRYHSTPPRSRVRSPTKVSPTTCWRFVIA